jgi:hypothetical protein
LLVELVIQERLNSRSPLVMKTRLLGLRGFRQRNWLALLHNRFNV